MSSRIASWSLLNGYYFSVISLTKIGLGDYVIKDTKFMLLSCFYTLFGLAFFDLTINRIQEKLRYFIVHYCQHLINEVVRFFNQLGYNWSLDSVNFDQAIAGSFKLSISAMEALTANSSKSDQSDLISQSVDVLKSDSAGKHSSKKRMKQTGDHSFVLNDTNKCDKQTQITTLLCSRYNLEKSTSLETLYTPPVVASIKPNRSLKNSLSYKSLDVPNESEEVEKEPEPVTEVKLTIKPRVTVEVTEKEKQTTTASTVKEPVSSNTSESPPSSGNDLASIRLRRSNRFASSSTTTTTTSSPASSNIGSTSNSGTSSSSPTSSSISSSGSISGSSSARIYKSSRFN